MKGDCEATENSIRKNRSVGATPNSRPNFVGIGVQYHKTAMKSRRWYSRILPAPQVALAGLFGGWGLWQRHQILSHDYLFGIGWNTTAKFHIWPWPFKLAVCLNFPAFMTGSLLSWPIRIVWPKISQSASESLEMVLCLFLVPILWYRVGLKLDRRWEITDRPPWIALSVFAVVCLAGALLPIGYVGFLPYGCAVWMFATFVLVRGTHTCPGIPKTAS
jgi:hypothetical protein